MPRTSVFFLVWLVLQDPRLCWLWSRLYLLHWETRCYPENGAESNGLRLDVQLHVLGYQYLLQLRQRRVRAPLQERQYLQMLPHSRMCVERRARAHEDVL